MISKFFSQLLILILKFLALFPLFFLHVISKAVYFFSYKIFKYRVKIVKKNLNNSFPEKSRHEIQQLVKQFYRHFSELIVEVIKMPEMSANNLSKRIRFKNPEVFQELISKKQNFIACAGHLGNWEWATAAFALQVAPQNFKVLNVYKQLNNPYFDKYMLSNRNIFGGEAVEMKQTLRKVINLKSQNYCLVLAADQSPAWNDLQFFTSFLHQRTPVYLGVEKLAKKLNLPVIFFHTHKIKSGYYEVSCEMITHRPLQNSEKEITLAHIQALEKSINLQPYNWLWSHDRWKHSQANLPSE